MIENSKRKTIGFTFSYDFFSYDAHCKYTLCLYKEFQNHGLGAIAGIKMMDYLFKKYPLSVHFFFCYVSVQYIRWRVKC